MDGLDQRFPKVGRSSACVPKRAGTTACPSRHGTWSSPSTGSPRTGGVRQAFQFIEGSELLGERESPAQGPGRLPHRSRSPVLGDRVRHSGTGPGLAGPASAYPHVLRGPGEGTRLQHAPGKTSALTNAAGIAHPAVDALLEKVLGARSLDELTTAAHALDRVLLWNYYHIPLQGISGPRVVHWDKFGRPGEDPPYRTGSRTPGGGTRRRRNASLPVWLGRRRRSPAAADGRGGGAARAPLQALVDGLAEVDAACVREDRVAHQVHDVGMAHAVFQVEHHARAAGAAPEHAGLGRRQPVVRA